MVKNCDLGHSFSPYGPPSRQITYIYEDEDSSLSTFTLAPQGLTVWRAGQLTNKP